MKQLRLLVLVALLIVAGTRARSLPLGLGVGLRVGGATENTSGLLLGMDFSVPGFSLFHGLKTRLDFDTWGQPTSGWDRSNGGIAAIFSQLADGGVGYVGVGGGVSRIRSHGTSHTGVELKFIAGMNLLGLGVEANYHVGRISTWTGMIRFRF